MSKLTLGKAALTGLGAYLIASKGIRALRGMVSDVADAIKWRAYYKCEREDPLAPGYERRADDSDISADGGNPPKKPDSAAMGKAISDAVVKTIDALFKRPDKAKNASEGDLEASCEDEDENDNIVDLFPEENAEETSLDTAEEVPTTEEKDEDK